MMFGTRHSALGTRRSTKGSKGVIAAVLVLIGLPVVLAAVEAVSFYVLNRSNGTIVSSGLKREYLLYVPANGLSNGGGMAFVLSCTLSDRIAAVGVVAPALFLPWSSCKDQRTVPMIAFHGTADRAVPYHGGKSWVAPNVFPNIPAWTAAWARRNRCGTSPVESVVAADVSRREYTHCADDAAVVLYTVQGGGHTWPGGGPLPEWFVGRTSNSIDASSQMWAFFREHPLRDTQTAVRHK
jgi:poly(3-hydroxybutyrate) depolymerase